MNTAVAAGVAGAQVRETDVGVVVLIGDRAYKLKKPVTTELLDLGTPERRLAACRREVELNRRLAPDVYLGISSITDPVDPAADPGGAPAVEHFVVMRRMPEDRRLSHLVCSGAPVQEALRALARTVAVFHAAAPHDPEVTAEGSHIVLKLNGKTTVDARDERRAGGTIALQEGGANASGVVKFRNVKIRPL